MRIGIIIQARMGSQRLPGKVLMNLEHTPLLGHIILRLKRLKHDAQIIVATSSTPQDDAIASYCAREHIECFRGSESNVLERYYQCAKNYGFDHIVRLTADNPLVDVEELDNLIDLHLTSFADFSHSLEQLPKGVGCEMFSFHALEASFVSGTKPHHLEHVDEYLLENPHLFKTVTLAVPNTKQRNDINLSVDTLEDLKRIRHIFSSARTEYIETEEAIKICLAYA